MTITPLEAVFETDLLARGHGFETTPNGVVTPISRGNRDDLLPAIEERTV